jgi:hypothetical protein
MGIRATLRKRVTVANVIAFVALFVALSATSYAAFKLPANSVGTKQLKKGAVTTAKLATGSVDGSKVAPNSLTGQDIQDGSLTGADINVSTLGKVPSAATADTAGAAPIAKVLIVKAFGTNGFSGSGGNIAAATAVCPPGTFVIGGGTQLSDQNDQAVNDGYPSAVNAWTSDVFNDGAGTPGFTVYAICAPAAATG